MVTFAQTVTDESAVPRRHRLTEILSPGEANVGTCERVASGLAGGLLAVEAILRPSGPRLLMGLLGGALLYRGISGVCPLYNALGINRARGRMARPHDYYRTGIHVERSFIINRPADELYGFWRNFENLPRFMKHLQNVRKLDEKRSHWTARGPAGLSIHWDAEIINDEPNRLLAWRSLEDADVDNAGSVRFLPAADGPGTNVRISIDYIPPAGRLGEKIAWFFGESPYQQIEEDLQRFKDLMESGIT